MAKTTKGKNAMSVQKQRDRLGAAILMALPELEEDVMQGWIDNPKALQGRLEEFLCPPKNERCRFEITVDYTLSLLQMISRGHYDWTNESITLDHFPIHGTGKQDKEVVLFHFNRCISSDDAIREMNEAGYRPASIEDLLALGAAYPDLQRQFPIAALANPWHDSDGDRHVACLLRDGSKRYLFLHWLENDWDEYWRFLAVRK